MWALVAYRQTYSTSHSAWSEDQWLLDVVLHLSNEVQVQVLPLQVQVL